MTDQFSLNFAYRQTQVRSNSFLILHTTYGTMPVQYVPCSERLIVLGECNEYQYTFCVLAEDVPAGLDLCLITPDLIIDPYLTPNNTLNLESSESNTILGTGTDAAPYTVNLNVDPIVDNLIEVTAAGVKVILPADGFTAADRIKLDGIEDNATADQTPAEIKVAYESNVNTNAFTDAQETKLNGLPADATGNQTGAEIVALIDAEPDANLLDDTEYTKLGGIEDNADVTDEINVGSTIAGATNKFSPVAADLFSLSDSEAGDVLRSISWAAIQAALGVNSSNIYLSDTKTDGTVGGQAAIGWNTRDLNTTDRDVFNTTAQERIAFTSGGTYEVLPLDEITGGTSGTTATVHSIELTSGTWAGGDAAGFIWVNDIVGTFVAEDLSVGVEINVATTDGIVLNDAQFRVLTGEYDVTVTAPASELGNTLTAIYSDTDSAYILYGTNSNSGSTAGDPTVPSVCVGHISLTEANTLEIRQNAELVGPVDGLGPINGLAGIEERYTSIILTPAQ